MRNETQDLARRALRWPGTSLLFLSAISLLAGPAFSQKQVYDQRQDYTVDAELGFSTGPEVGQVVPKFSLPDQNGKTVSLQQLLGKKGALLNFYRSASW